MHHLFLSDDGIGVLCFNITRLLNNSVNELKVRRFSVQSVAFHSKEAPLLLVGTHCKDIATEELRHLNAVIAEEVLLKYFFPVDNSLKKKNKHYLTPLRRNIEAIFWEHIRK